MASAKDSAAKVFPILAGLAIGWLLFHPPAVLASLGSVRFLVMLGVGFVLLLGVIMLVISASLPRDVKLTPEPGPVPPELRGLVDRFSALGFEAVGPGYRVGVSPPAVMVGLVHPVEPVYATVYRTGTLPAVTNFDCITILDGFRGGLTSNPDPRGASLPSGSRGLRQVLPGAGVEQVFRQHCDAVAYLRSRGLPPKPVSAQSFATDFKRGMAMQREDFLRSPLRYALVALGRSVTKKVPQVGPLRLQSAAEGQIRELVTKSRPRS
jgi:hypothetical protein